MDKFELIKTAHVVDYQMGTLAAAMVDEALKGKILSLQAEWQELAYRVAACLCGVESVSLPGSRRKRSSQKGAEISTEQAENGNDENSTLPSSETNTTTKAEVE